MSCSTPTTWRRCGDGTCRSFAAPLLQRTTPPQKGKRALACHVLPGTPAMTFGKEGGLVELLYAGTGFLLVRREVYLAVGRQLEVPVCNERFGHPMMPFFLPQIRPVEEADWYLAEDYAFCHRARSCGYKIHADSSVRLWHIGTYRYGWEDAGVDRERYGAFKLNFNDRIPAGGTAPPEAALRSFMDRHPWPAAKPAVPPPPQRGWLFPATRQMLAATVPPEARLIVELGSFTGSSTRFLAAHGSVGGGDRGRPLAGQ